ncbi:DnaJ domain-containing protein [uncultured Nocardioides sp.]|uniref:J domain-containing protein n=1 Tax=uncultured Nocardioides sp. TaxID=198441 RepID=UPI002634D0FF|nr:DnaJ domain-containing protein [uncultured Nocardioides sp.]
MIPTVTGAATRTTSSAAAPTWYDLLGVEVDAGADEIRTAWKSAIADLDPGDRRFRVLNEAAEALLDPARRAAYDDTLEPTVAEVRGAPAASLEASQAEAAVPTRARRPVPAWLLAALAVLVALLVAAAGYLATQPSDAAIADGTGEAQGAAEQAVTTILSYDYRHLDQDQAASGELMTPAYRKKYDALFSQIAANAPDLKAVVTAQVVASGIVRSGEDRVQVQIFVNRPTLRKDLTEPQVYRDQVVLTMERSGDQWLVDDMDTNNLGS